VAQIAERLVDLDEGFIGMALPAREDGPADDWNEDGHGRVSGRGYLMKTLNQPAFLTCGLLDL
jgi:hypothetical protein